MKESLSIGFDGSEALSWFENLLKIDTSNSLGNERPAAVFIQDILREEGIESSIHENAPGRSNLVSKLDGGDEPPLLLISHLDVADVDESKWRYPPFSATLAENKVWSRGTLDTKHLTIMQLASFIELKREQLPLNRDVYFIATADEENGSEQGMAYMIRNHPEYFPNGIVINEGGGFYVSYRKKKYLLLSVGEKGSCKIRVDTKGQGGHASCPPDDQAIQKLSAVIRQLLDSPLPKLRLGVLEEFLRILGIEDGEKGTDDDFDSDNSEEGLLKQLYHYMLDSEVRVKQIDVGEQINAIPYKATAQLEFKLLPGTTREDIESFIQKALKEIEAEWEIESFQEGFVNDADSNTSIASEFQNAIRKFGFDAELLPFLALGKTDGRFLDNSHVLGFSPVCDETPFADVLNKVHKPDESISVNSFVFGTQVMREAISNFCKGK